MNWTKESAKSEVYHDIWSSASNYLNFLKQKTNNLDAVNSMFNKIGPSLGPSLKILDLGCGMAWTSALLKQKYDHKITLIDLYDGDKVFDKHSRDMFKLLNVSYDNVNFIHGNFNNISVLRTNYDMIIMTSAIHHIYELDALLIDIKGLLSNDGIFLILNENPVGHLKYSWYLLKNYIHDFFLHLFRPRYKLFKQISHCGIKYDPILGDYYIPARRYKYLLDTNHFDYQIFDSGFKQYIELKTDHTLKHILCQKKKF